MLMVSTDHRLDRQAAGWVVRTIIEGVRAAAADLVVGESLADRALAAAPHRASVVALDPSESDSVQRTTAAAAAGVVWVTAGSGRGLRDRLRLNSGPATRVPLALVVVADHAVDTAQLRLLAGAKVVRAVPYAPARRSERTLAPPGPLAGLVGRRTAAHGRRRPGGAPRVGRRRGRRPAAGTAG